MATKKRSKTGPLIAAGAVGIGLYLWSQSQAQAAQAVDARWLAQQELARRQAAGAATPGMDTLGTILKLGGSGVALGTTAYKLLSKIFTTGTETEAVAAVNKLIADGTTGLTT